MADFNFKRLQEEYIKVRDEYTINDDLNVFWNIFSVISGHKSEDLPDFIRQLTSYRFAEIPIDRKIFLEGLLKDHPNSLQTDVNFKIDNLHGCFCHSVREIVFHLGCVNNMPFVLPADYNTKQHYGYLVEKKRYLNELKGKLQRFCLDC